LSNKTGKMNRKSIRLILSVGAMLACAGVSLWVNQGWLTAKYQVWQHRQALKKESQSEQPILVPRPKRPALPKQLRVAFLNMESVGDDYAAWVQAQTLSEAVRWQSVSDAGFAWVDRESFEQAAAELEIDLANNQALSIGRWLHANLVVVGALIVDQDEQQANSVRLDIIEPMTGGIVVSDHVTLPADVNDSEGAEVVVLAMRRLLRDAEAELREQEDDKVLRLVHISNLTGSARMDKIAWDLSDQLAESIQQKPGVRLARTQRPMDAAQEGALTLLGLTTVDPDAWQAVGDYYLWGGVEEVFEGEDNKVVERAADQRRVKLTFWLWDTLSDPIAFEKTVSLPDLSVAVGQLVNRVATEAAAEQRELVSLSARDKVIEVLMDNRFVSSVWNRPDNDATPKQLARYRDELWRRELAWFFDPNNGKLANAYLDSLPRGHGQSDWWQANARLEMLELMTRLVVSPGGGTGGAALTEQQHSIAWFHQGEIWDEYSNAWHCLLQMHAGYQFARPERAYSGFPSGVPDALRQKWLRRLAGRIERAAIRFEPFADQRPKTRLRVAFATELRQWLEYFAEHDSAAGWAIWQAWKPVTLRERWFGVSALDGRLGAVLARLSEAQGQPQAVEQLRVEMAKRALPTKRPGGEAKVDPALAEARSLVGTLDIDTSILDQTGLAAFEAWVWEQQLSMKLRASLSANKYRVKQMWIRNGKVGQDPSLVFGKRSSSRKLKESPPIFILPKPRFDETTVPKVAVRGYWGAFGRESMGRSMASRSVYQRVLDHGWIGPWWVALVHTKHGRRVAAIHGVSLAEVDLNDLVPEKRDLNGLAAVGDTLWLSVEDDGLYVSRIGQTPRRFSEDDGLRFDKWTGIQAAGDRVFMDHAYDDQSNSMLQLKQMRTVIKQAETSDPMIIDWHISATNLHGILGAVGHRYLWRTAYGHSWANGRLQPENTGFVLIDSTSGESETLDEFMGYQKPGLHEASRIENAWTTDGALWVMDKGKLMSFDARLKRGASWPAPFDANPDAMLVQTRGLLWWIDPFRWVNPRGERIESAELVTRVCALDPTTGRVLLTSRLPGRVNAANAQDGALALTLTDSAWPFVMLDTEAMLAEAGIDRSTSEPALVGVLAPDRPGWIGEAAYKAYTGKLVSAKSMDSVSVLSAVDAAGTLPLYAAVRGRQHEVVDWLLDNEADPNGRLSTFPALTPLHLAAVQNNTVLIDALLKAGADPDQPNLVHGLPVHTAIANGSGEAVDLLVKRLGAAQNRPVRTLAYEASSDGDFFWPAMLAVVSKNPIMQEKVLGLSWPISGELSSEMVEMQFGHVLVRQRRTALLKELAQRGLLPEIVGQEADVLFEQAVKDENEQIINDLLDAGLRPESLEELMVYAAMFEGFGAVDRLLRLGADPNVPVDAHALAKTGRRDHYSRGHQPPCHSLLTWAFYNGHHQLFDLLIEHKRLELGRMIGAFRQGDWLVRAYLEKGEYVLAAKLVLSGYHPDAYDTYGAQIQRTRNYGAWRKPPDVSQSTLLEEAVRYKTVSSVQALLRLRADASALTVAGESMVDVAGQAEMKAVLMQHQQMLKRGRRAG